MYNETSKLNAYIIPFSLTQTKHQNYLQYDRLEWNSRRLIGKTFVTPKCIMSKYFHDESISRLLMYTSIRESVGTSRGRK